ncbi:MAG: hypothetical protein IVW36_09190 [Dehalococcoidia bacterium]|nr:hypothetical protein [Dehalococcoidia bacterium]
MASTPVVAVAPEVAPRPVAVRGDLAGVGVPLLLFLVVLAVVAVVLVVLEGATAAAGEMRDATIYGGVSLTFAYVPYLTGYISCRIAAVSSGTRTVVRVVAGVLGLSVVAAAVSAAAGDPTLAVMILLVFGIPSVAGLIACGVQARASAARRASTS